jgi:hypothetical protein
MTATAIWFATPNVGHPRLRRASLTEVLIALLEEGPRTPDEIADLIWRKRAAEHGGQA